MPGAEFKEGTINSYDRGTQLGNYREINTTTDRDFETLNPVPVEINIDPGVSVRVMVTTPSGRIVSIGRKIGTSDV